MKNILIYLAVVFLLLLLGVAFYVDGYPVSSRKSTPPVKATDPNDIKYREDICNGRGNYSEPYPERDGEITS